MDDVALIHQTQPDAPGDGSSDPAVGQLNLGGLDVRLVTYYRPRGLAQHRLLIVEVLSRDYALLVQGSIPRQGDFRIEQRGLVFRQLPLSLGQLRLVWARVDFHQQVALMHRLAFFEGDVHDLAVNPALDRHGVESGNGTYRREVAVQVAALRRRRRNRHRRAGCGRCLSGWATRSTKAGD